MIKFKHATTYKGKISIDMQRAIDESMLSKKDLILFGMFFKQIKQENEITLNFLNITEITNEQKANLFDNEEEEHKFDERLRIFFNEQDDVITRLPADYAIIQLKIHDNLRILFVLDKLLISDKNNHEEITLEWGMLEHIMYEETFTPVFNVIKLTVNSEEIL